MSRRNHLDDFTRGRMIGKLEEGRTVTSVAAELRINKSVVSRACYCDEVLLPHVRLFRGAIGPDFIFMDANARPHRTLAVEELLESEDIPRMDWPAYSPDLNPIEHVTVTAGSDVVQSGRPIFDDFFQHLWPYIGNNTANVVFQMVKRLWLIRIDQ
ncbi:transposable element Tc1 transposase [Trichonephila clavipes]|nr:transposable element Tc1 transposase [Trichonephila clavipes]